MDDDLRGYRVRSIRASQRLDDGAPVPTDGYDGSASAWAGASGELLGAPDGWTAKAVLAAMWARHPQGMSGDQADGLAADLRDVVRWRRNLVARADPGVDHFVTGRRAIGFEEALVRARAWIVTRTRPATSPDPEMRRTRSGWEVLVPSEVTPWVDGVAFRSPDEASCRAALAAVRDHRAFVREWRQLGIPDVTRSTHLDGVTVTLGKIPSENLLFVTFRREGRSVGSGGFEPATLVRHLVMGGRLLSGGRGLNEGYVGVGLGGVMHDLVEEVTGLRVVPHGINGNKGILTRASMSFYAKRVSRGADLGFGDAERERCLKAMRGRSRCDLGGDVHSRVMLVLGAMVGGRLSHCCTTMGTSGNLAASPPWLTLADGRVLTTAGPQSWADLLDDMDERVPRAHVRDLSPEESALTGSASEVARATRIAAHLAYDLGLVDVVPAPLDLHPVDMGHLAVRDAIVADAGLRAALMASEVPAAPR